MATTTEHTEHTETNTEQGKQAEGYATVKAFCSAPDAVPDALHTTEAISAWWGPASGSATEGGTFRASFGGDRYHDIVVTSFEPHRVVWTSAAAPHHNGEWEGTTMVFELAPKG